jgi:hypothetical protein
VRIPKVVYEIYPWLYISGGAGALSIGTNTVAMFSGSLLFVSGVAILFLRRNYRTTEQIIQKLQTHS